jgi:limonene 1,2-monooxygenase
MDSPLRFGIFLAPFHPAGQNPTLAIERDLELIVRLDELGYNEAWIGEHHSAGFEIIASPEVFIAAAAQRTKNIRLGTGVSSLPYHHPLILADRMVLLDHLTRGRAMFGVGPGALPSDAYMMGIDPARQREMMEESLEAMIALLTDDEPVNMVTDWFTLKDARLQLRPYTHPCFEIGVAAQISPAGPRAAGRFGIALLSLGATTAGGFDVLGAHWQTAEERAAQFGTSVERRRWRLVGPMHIRETEEQAQADVAYGLADWVSYFQEVAALPIAPNTDDHGTILDAMNASGIAVIGTPEMAVAQIHRLIDQSGGFGTYLFMAHDWADPKATLASYELFAREVMPVFQHSAQRSVRSRNWAADNRPQFIGDAITAVGKAITDHQAEKELREQAGPEEAGRARTAGTAG